MPQSPNDNNQVAFPTSDNADTNNGNSDTPTKTEANRPDSETQQNASAVDEDMKVDNQLSSPLETSSLPDDTSSNSTRIPVPDSFSPEDVLSSPPISDNTNEEDEQTSNYIRPLATSSPNENVQETATRETNIKGNGDNDNIVTDSNENTSSNDNSAVPIYANVDTLIKNDQSNLEDDNQLSNTMDDIDSNQNPSTQTLDGNKRNLDKDDQVASNVGIDGLVRKDVQPNADQQAGPYSNEENGENLNERSALVSNPEPSLLRPNPSQQTTSDFDDENEANSNENSSLVVSPATNVGQQSKASKPLPKSSKASKKKQPTDVREIDNKILPASLGPQVVFFVAGLVFILSLVQLIIGGLYKDSCPSNPYIPIYLIVSGILGLVLPILLLCLVSFSIVRFK